MPTARFTAGFLSPVGWVRIDASDRGISSISFQEETVTTDDALPDFMNDAVTQLGEYFACKRQRFEVLPLAIAATDFQDRVWSAASEIPFGETVTYGDLAKSVQSPDAARAVGTALSRNPVVIVVPCHRIIPSTGECGEYAGGAWRKEWLLKHEGKKM
ncbi:methylated-DNA--[protein]-cysteine S-methyltransferase [Candidatus Uhrbacteria bacterium]|nr:methylated-DNA--[protein]-cysteine S-methyltransferase [Candidatus Uhrbacteria bacterium]